MGRKIYSKEMSNNPIITKLQDEYFNSLGEILGVRTPEVVLAPGKKFYLNIEVQPKTEMVIHERFINGRGLGALKIKALKNTNALIGELDIFSPYIEVGEVVSANSKYQYTTVDIGGDVVTALPSYAYLGDESAVTVSRSADRISVPTIAFERIIRNDTESAFRFGFEFEMVNVVNSEYQGYLELYFTEKNIS
jgi:hypothetical protein